MRCCQPAPGSDRNGHCSPFHDNYVTARSSWPFVVDAVDLSRLRFSLNLIGNFLRKSLSLGETPTERFKKTLVPFTPLPLGAGLRIGRQWRRDRQPEADEQCQRLGPDRNVPFQPLHLPRQAIQPAVAGPLRSAG